MTLDLATGRRTQLTTLAKPAEGVATGTRFVNPDTIVFVISNALGEPFHFFTIKTDGSGFEELPEDVPAPGAAVIPDFTVVGGGSALLTISVRVTPPTAPVSVPGRCSCSTARISFSSRTSAATTPRLTSSDRGVARCSARGPDPLGTNPAHIPQISPSIRSVARCDRSRGWQARPSGVARLLQCLVDSTLTLQDPVTDNIVFQAPCGGLADTVTVGQISRSAPTAPGSASSPPRVGVWSTPTAQ